MRQRVQFVFLCGALIAAPQFAAAADQGAAGGLIGGGLRPNAPVTSESNAEAVRNLGAPAVGSVSAEDDCVDTLGAAATGGADQDGDVRSAGETVGQGLAAASRTGCTSESNSVGQAIGAGTQDATQAIVGE